MTNQQAPDPNALIMGSGARSAKFQNVKDQVWGTIMSSETRQQTDLQGNPKFFDKEETRPMWQVRILLQTDEHEDEDDDGVRAVYARGQMLNAIGKACTTAGVKGIANGGKLVIRYVKDEPAKQRGYSPAKQYVAKYEPPAQLTEIPIADEDYEDVEPF